MLLRDTVQLVVLEGLVELEGTTGRIRRLTGYIGYVKTWIKTVPKFYNRSGHKS